jgi:acyl-CoA synthetase (AMP-forming)/AMP-acid ligase II
MGHNVASLLVAAAALGDDSAVVEQERATTYTGLAARAGAYAEALRHEDLAPGSRVAVLLERGADGAAAVFGIHAAGSAAVVVNDRLRPRQVEHILDDSDAVLLLTTADQLARQGRDLATRARLLEASAVPLAAPLVPVPREAGDLAQIIYTSGSTGLPKGVMHTHGSIGAGVTCVAAYLGLRRDDRIASLLAYSSVYGLNQLLCSVATGATLVVERSAFPADIVAALRRERVSVAAGVPPLWLQLLAVPEFGTPIRSLRQLQNAGGHLPVDAVRRIRAAQPHAELFLQYGMTETWRSTFLPPAETDLRPGSMGRAVPGAEIHVVREDGSLCGDMETGEVVHAGPTIAAGYWRAPTASADVFRSHPLRPAERAVFSGDFARRDAGGFLYYVGRRDRLIKTMGHRIGPDEVADVLYASGQVGEAVVAAEDDPERGQRIVAWVVLAKGGSVERLTRYCRVELPAYMQPARIEPREQLPRLAGGKFDLDALRAGAP